MPDRKTAMVALIRHINRRMDEFFDQHKAEEFSTMHAATTEMRRRAALGDPVKHLNRKFDYRVLRKSIVWEVVAIEPAQ